MASDQDNIFKAILTSSGILVFGLAFQMGLGFLGRLVIARFLGKVNYGSVSLGYTLLVTASIFVVVGVDKGVGRYLPRYDDQGRRRGVLLSAIQVVVPMAAVIGVLNFILADFIASFVFNEPEIAPVFRIFGIAIPFAAFVRLTIGSIQGMKEALPRVYIENIALPLTRFSLIALAIVLGFESVGVAWAYTGAYIVAATFSLIYLWKKTPLLDKSAPVFMRKELLLFSAPLMISATMNIILSNLDIFMLGILSSPGDVGVYNVAYPLAEMLTVLLTAFNFVFMPIMSELHSSNKYGELERTYQVVSKWIFVFTLPLFIVLAFYPKIVISYTFGSEYTGGALALTVLTIGFFTHTIVGPTGNTLMAVGESRLIMYDNISVAVVNAILNLILIPRYSFLGAAVATTIGYLLMNGLYLHQLQQKIGIHPIRPELIRPAIASLGSWTALYLIGKALPLADYLAFITSVLLFIPIYGTIIIRYGGIEREEMMMMQSVEDRLGIDLNPVKDVARRFTE
ncbi:flippase [Halegenticoccus tardaugens]|uniref:flippase n=1 Tax=Halegenticoccus tardaugens TaxID=2071624 RepID=UPI00100A8751|nr:flippase [Halegenticoccus tardaugens]